MTKPLPHPNFFHRLIKHLAATRFGIWLLADNLHRVDAHILKWSGNRTSLTTWLTGLPVVVLNTIGAKSGLPRRTPLIALLDGEKIILIASRFGSPHNPGWYYNLKAHPQVQVILKGEEKTYLSQEVKGEERQCYWQMAVAWYPGYALYKRRAHPRIIPVLVLEPVENTPTPN